ncbi:hypothetical protein jhhlp_007768 [Lomentospora prolificans]|uniref:Ipa protein n=1 Tax=Lomentospora prolificans TaxID=41688 RepID=A0A2N3N0I9_9PEZI|nr:hypothetical protein jhhlp_007768 [Lomentospora prolificans]
MNMLPAHNITKELQSDLAHKYKRHKTTIITAWRSFDKKQREACMRAGAVEGVVLEHPLDRSLGDIYKIIPEWNVRDVCGDPDYFLELLHHRATKTVFDQYCKGPDGGMMGDKNVIHKMMHMRGLRHVNEDEWANCYSLFMDENSYGQSFEVRPDHLKTFLTSMKAAVNAGFCVPKAMGEFILHRQTTMLQLLNVMVDDVLEEGSKTKDKSEMKKKPAKAAATAMSRLTISDAPAKLSPPELVTAARDQKESLEEYLSLVTHEPVVLAHATNLWFYSRPELIADEKGRRLPVHGDKYISAAVLEAVKSTVQAVAIWDYLTSLLDLLEKHNKDKVYRVILLQEIANVCYLEYDRAQAVFKRQVHTASGAKYFKRVSSVVDKSGNARVSMKVNPQEFTRSDPQLHYILRLCQPETTAAKAIEWAKKLGELHLAEPEEREKLTERESEPLYDLMIIISFIQDLSSAISIPSLSRKRGQQFIARYQKLEEELNSLKTEIDLRDFAVPINNLLEPGMTDGAMKALDEFVTGRAGTKMGFLYYDLVQDCVAELQSRYEQSKAKLEQIDKPVATSAPTSGVEAQEIIAEQRRQKEKVKTRPPHSSVYEIAPQPESAPVIKDSTESRPSQRVKVSSSTADVFMTLFEKSKSRGSVNWTAFESAMVELGFSVFPKFGSVYTFSPPESLGFKRSLTIHRPHQSRIEGYLLPIFARRLKRVYGWTEKTFEVV